MKAYRFAMVSALALTPLHAQAYGAQPGRRRRSGSRRVSNSAKRIYFDGAGGQST